MRPTKEEILGKLTVDLENGRCFWKISGKEAGGLVPFKAGPRWRIRWGKVQYFRAHLIFVVAHGSWPFPCLDHIDGNATNDVASNLRSATATQNAWNHRKRKKKSKTPMGVRQVPTGKFQSRIAVNKKTIHLGTFESLAEAHAIYLAKRKELYGAYCGC